MTELQKEFEATGYASWINSDAYPDGKIYTDEYVKWLEKQVVVLRNSQPNPLGWISVEDRLPELDETVLLFDDWQTREGKEYKDVRVGYLSSFTTMNTSKGISHNCEWRVIGFAFNITHWQPLPNPPKAAEHP